MTGPTDVTTGVAAPHADVVLEFVGTPESQGATCALLTPLVKARLRDMQVGQILEIQVDDPTAREDLASWCRLSGHELLTVTTPSSGLLRAYVRKSHA